MSDQPLRHAETPPATIDDAVYVAPGMAGRGIFAARDFARGDIVLHFDGQVFTGDELDRLGYVPGYPLQIDLDRFMLLDEPYVFCNHSCDPNTGLTAELQLRAVRDIKRGDELSFDYSTTMLEDHSWSLECGCKTALCRGRVQDFDLLDAATQRRLVDEVGVLPFITRELARRGA